jgi:hypothetical protein
MAKSKLKYPKLIYVGIEHERDTTYFTAFADPTEAADLADEKEVAIYELVKTAKVRTKVEVV